MELEVNKIICGKMEEVLKTFPDNYFDSIVTDSPYGLKFMGKKWDYEVPTIYQWEQAIRVLKPGGHLLSACGTRTQHRMVVNIEDAGFEIRDIISWIYGSGFPKSLDISKAIDKQAGEEREVIGEKIERGGKRNRKPIDDERFGYQYRKEGNNTIEETAPATDAAKEWQGYGTALKPATELWTLARKPISENTIAENVLKHGTGGLNIDGCRVESDDKLKKHIETYGINSGYGKDSKTNFGQIKNSVICGNEGGRFPANLILDEFMAAELDRQSGESTDRPHARNPNGRKHGLNAEVYGEHAPQPGIVTGHEDSGGASRFFYCAKADRFERNKGKSENKHPTVKPIELMRYLVRLITPKHGICLDPFCGSGTTLIACKQELMNYIGIDISEEYCRIAEARVKAWNPERYLKQTLF